MEKTGYTSMSHCGNTDKNHSMKIGSKFLENMEKFKYLVMELHAEWK